MRFRVAVGRREVAAVLLGGMLGTGIRLAVDVLMPHGSAEVPVGTLLVNTVGSFTLGLLISTLWGRPGVPYWLKAGAGAGLLGAFTTFSAIMVSLVAQAASGQWMLASGYLIASVALGLLAAGVGLRLGRRPDEPDWVDE
ncbi:MAG TPA: CrcB family protein [Homoserinimonas sp.]|nr:CrcB family protein [Homoserinimonas sp.]